MGLFKIEGAVSVDTGFRSVLIWEVGNDFPPISALYNQSSQNDGFDVIVSLQEFLQQQRPATTEGATFIERYPPMRQVCIHARFRLGS